MQKTPKPKSEAEIKAEMIKRQETNHFRSVLKNKIYPILLEKTKSVEDAKMVASVAAITINQYIAIKNQELFISDLNIPETKEGYDIYNDIFNILKGEKATTSEQLMRGLSDVIDSFIKEENTKRPLSSLPAELLDPEEDEKN